MYVTTDDYKIVRGLVADVEEEVNRLLKKGYALWGHTMMMRPPGEDVEIVVQAMMKMPEEECEWP